ncbi:MAG TPA: flagellar basal-body rod protein FlgF [Terracidiphilus sp.]|nr:flagellar basal-body rod protein FlgF [Terracidiphilus sp.]
MDSGFYAAMTGLVARSQALDTAASNLANAQTPGYRAEREYFRSALLGPDSDESQLGQTVNHYGLLGGDRISLAQGALQTTGNPLDLALDGSGFFAVETKNGLRYTRDGSFRRSQKGFLITQKGETVLSQQGKPIALPPGQVSVGGDGVISVAGGTVGQVGVFDFAPGVELTPEGANRYIAPKDAKPVAPKDTEVHQGALESANQDVIQGTMDLVLMQRQFEMMQKALTVFHTEFNKIASEELPRIS